MFTQVTPPATLPIPLDALKAALRIDRDDEDALLDHVQRTAVTVIERRLDRALLRQSWSLSVQALPQGPLALRPGQVVSIDSVEATYGAATPFTLREDAIKKRLGDDAWVCVELPYTQGTDTFSSLTISFSAGAEDAGALPADLLHAVYLLSAHYYEERELFRRDRYVPVPLSVDALIAPYRLVRL
ncbi:phage head-tail connector protein [Parvularcula sp. LCG005]|uniref:head-tail connector protein n=1 Tax=Parvularcula sp. LCG005 TaxID=3078805 RepID=UPI002943C7A9|nr:phage head-tail connector protein [Parvularcula sp. LCG005]WOI53993.1 phage head-tail connector protein [Parvularcula sp. LCG005]